MTQVTSPARPCPVFPGRSCDIRGGFPIRLVALAPERKPHEDRAVSFLTPVSPALERMTAGADARRVLSAPRRAAPSARPRGHARGAPAGRRPRVGVGAGRPGQTTPPASSPRSQWQSPPGWGRLALPLPSRLIHIHEGGERRGPGRRRPPAPGLESRPGGGLGPSGAPPASASGREFPLGHDSKMCRSRFSAPLSLPWGGLLLRKAGGQEGRGQGKDGSSPPPAGPRGSRADPFSSKLAPAIIFFFPPRQSLPLSPRA